MKVVDIFSSFQGEGYYTGVRATFIRLGGCNLNCYFCDTDWSIWKEFNITEIIKLVEDKLVVITGGEPLLQDLDDLVLELKKDDHIIAIETNGTIEPSKIVKENCYITVSPKGNWIIREADEVKVVNTGKINLKDYDCIKANRWIVHPVDIEGYFNYKDTVNLVKKGEEKWMLGIQLHKAYSIL